MYLGYKDNDGSVNNILMPDTIKFDVSIHPPVLKLIRTRARVSTCKQAPHVITQNRLKKGSPRRQAVATTHRTARGRDQTMNPARREVLASATAPFKSNTFYINVYC